MKCLANLIFVIACLVWLNSCSTNRRLNADDLQKDQGIALGHIDVMFNGADQTKLCSLLLHYDGKAQRFALDATGFVVFKASQGRIELQGLLCLDQDGASYVHYFSDASFYNYGKMVKTYFGHLRMNWIVEEKKKGAWYTPFLRLFRSELAAQSEGQAKMFVQRKTQAALDDFDRMNHDLPRMGTRVMLIKEGKTR